MHLAQKRLKKVTLLLAGLSLCVCALVFLTGCGGGGSGGGGSNVEGPPRDTTPVVLQVSQPGIDVVADDDAVLDYSNASDGYICVMSNLSDIRVKVLVEVAGAQYQYSIDMPGVYITIPLSEGDGMYVVGVWRNVTGDQYSAVFSHSIDVVLSSEFTPFLYPNQFVDFALGDASTNLSQELAAGSVTDVDVINNIYRWVSGNIDYDMDKAVTVASGYLPNNTDTLNAGMGICFDYAVLTASMLRAQQVPARLVIGYAGTAYHAWLEVYSVDTGTVLSYNFDGNHWVLMDPTFDAARRNTFDLSNVIGDGAHYQPMFFY